MIRLARDVPLPCRVATHLMILVVRGAAQGWKARCTVHVSDMKAAWAPCRECKLKLDTASREKRKREGGAKRRPKKARVKEEVLL